MFGRTVQDVALLAKVLIKKDHHDPATIYYSAENILEETKKGPAYEPKFIFYKSDYWKIIDKKSRESFEYLLNHLKILRYLILHHILKIFINIIKLFMKLI
jgi:Asp-tRNA(Asn)/Glu-tRNA(Gln) amidotransferase A subunit family amidase